MRFQLLRRWSAFAHRCPLKAKYILFLGVAGFRLMPDDTHDMRLIPLLVEGILHRLAIHRQRFVLRAPDLIPSIERTVQHRRFNPHQAVSNHKFAGNDNALSTGL